MYDLILHIEYLLRDHECVILPGLGAFIARRIPAHFIESEEITMLPPARLLTFNPELSLDDGLLAKSLCRRNRCTYPQAMAAINRGVEEIRAMLANDGELVFGHLGTFTLEDGRVIFHPQPDAVNWQYADLSPIHPRELTSRQDTTSTTPVILSPTQALSSDDTVDTDSEHRKGFWRRSGIAVAASLAVLVTVTLFIFNPIRLDNEPVKASLAPADTNFALIAAENRLPQPVDSVLTIGLPADLTPSDGVRFRTDDPWCVVVISFPSLDEAQNYIAANPGHRLGITQNRKWYLVYAATGTSQADAYQQSRKLDVPQCWFSRK